MTSKRREKAAHLRKNKSGLPSTGKPDFLAVGKLHRPHGLHGEILMGIQTDFPERLQPEGTVFIGDEKEPITIRSSRPHSKGLLISFNDYESRDQVAELRNQMVFVRTADRPPLPEGVYYHHQLIGLQVITDQGKELGVLAEILETGANDVYLVRVKGGKDILLPAIDEVIKHIDLQSGKVLVHLIPGLLPNQD
ncbi:MAG: 16S rRNA processing protein RimM [Chloroflexi bacterium]|nr:16S rRNA processing protein RimM [Chloroflexota bacterium]